MSNTYKHKIISKFNNGFDDNIPINIKKYWWRKNFDIGELRKLKLNKINKQIDDEIMEIVDKNFWDMI